MSLFAPRYKRYAAWPVVIWCRLRGHSPGRFWSGTTGRCVDCGDVVYAADAIPKMQQNVYYWGDRCDRAETQNAKLREALEMMVEEKADYMRLNHLGDPETQHTIKVARAALSSGERHDG